MPDQAFTPGAPITSRSMAPRPRVTKALVVSASAWPNRYVCSERDPGHVAFLLSGRIPKVAYEADVAALESEDRLPVVTYGRQPRPGAGASRVPGAATGRE